MTQSREAPARPHGRRRRQNAKTRRRKDAKSPPDQRGAGSTGRGNDAPASPWVGGGLTSHGAVGGGLTSHGGQGWRELTQRRGGAEPPARVTRERKDAVVQPGSRWPETRRRALLVSCWATSRSGRVEPSPEGLWDASQPRLWFSRGILRLAPADLRSLRMTLRRVGQPSLNGSVSCHVTPPRRGVSMLRVTWRSERPTVSLVGWAALRLRASAFLLLLGWAGASRLSVFAPLR